MAAELSSTGRLLPRRSGSTRRRVIAALAALVVLVGVIGAVLVTRKGGSSSVHLQSDDFTATKLSPIWTLVDPAGNAASGVTDGALSVAIPAGAGHSITAGQDDSVRALQPVPDTDFDIAATFTAAPGTGQSEGLSIGADAQSWLWVALTGTASGVHLTATGYGPGGTRTLADVSVPANQVAVRIKRVGPAWSVFTSRDGHSWSALAPFDFVLAAKQVGPGFATQGAPAPAFRGAVTSFDVDEDAGATVPPNIDALAATASSDTTATVTWHTNTAATTGVVYGGTLAYGQTADTLAGLTTDHKATMSHLACGTTYHFSVLSADIAANNAASLDQTVRTPACTGSNLRSDGFAGASLDGAVWQLTAPETGVALKMTGADAALVVDGGDTHDFGVKSANLPMLTQPLTSTNFDAYARFDSVTELPTQTQGLIAYADDANWVRFDESYSGGKTTVSLSGRVNGVTTVLSSVPLSATAGSTWLRLRKAGSQWTPSVSKDGYIWYPLGTFPQAVTPVRVGVTVGNVGRPAPRIAGLIDSFANAASPPAATGAAPVPAGAVPAISVWYGSSQLFGQNGIPQRWLNVLGNIASGTGLDEVRYAVDGGQSQPIGVGPDDYRLARAGDFNIELDRTRLGRGKHDVVITAIDLQGRSSTTTVTVDYEPKLSPLTPTVTWGANTTPTGAAQVVDGLWTVTKAGIRTAQPGYDRVLAIGDDNWHGDVSALMTVTVNSFTPDVPAAAIGLAIGWSGHTGSSQPKVGHPFGALCFYQTTPKHPYQMQILAKDDKYSKMEDRDEVVLGDPYLMRMVSRSVGGGNSVFSCRMWPAGTAEPSTYGIVSDPLPTHDGSVLVVAYNADVTVAAVKITR